MHPRGARPSGMAVREPLDTPAPMAYFTRSWRSGRVVEGDGFEIR